MNYKDVEVLNGSLDALGQNLLKQKMLKEQTAERQAQTGLASQRLATDQAFREAQQQHYNTMESKQADANDIAQQRAASQEDQGFLHTVIAANTAGMLDDDTLDQVNASLAEHPRLGRTGIQLSPPRVKTPQAGQNATAQAVQQAEYWHQKAQGATTDEDRARFVENEDIMRSIAQKSAAPVPPKADRSIEVKTGNAQAGEPVVTRKFSNQEFDAYKAGQPKGKPTRAMANTYVQKYGMAGALDALKKDGYDPSGYAD